MTPLGSNYTQSDYAELRTHTQMMNLRWSWSYLVVVVVIYIETVVKHLIHFQRAPRPEAALN